LDLGRGYSKGAPKEGYTGPAWKGGPSPGDNRGRVGPAVPLSKENSRWIGKAFGEGVREGKRTFTVLVKGVLKRDLKDTTEDEFGQLLGLSSVERAKFRILTTEGVIRATVLVTLTS